MNLFGLGPMELLLIMTIALLVLEPEKLPEAAALDKAVRELRRTTTKMAREFTQEFLPPAPQKALQEMGGLSTISLSGGGGGNYPFVLSHCPAGF